MKRRLRNIALVSYDSSVLVFPCCSSINCRKSVGYVIGGKYVRDFNHFSYPSQKAAKPTRLGNKTLCTSCFEFIYFQPLNPVETLKAFFPDAGNKAALGKSIAARISSSIISPSHPRSRKLLQLSGD